MIFTPSNQSATAAHCIARRQAFREFEHRGWQSAAEIYHDYWVELTQQSVEPMLAALAVNSGSELLDVACGPGYVATAAPKQEGSWWAEWTKWLTARSAERIKPPNSGTYMQIMHRSAAPPGPAY